MTRWHGTSTAVGLAPTCSCHRSSSGRSSDGGCELGIGDRLARVDLAQGGPHLSLEDRATNVERQLGCVGVPRTVDERHHRIHPSARFFAPGLDLGARESRGDLAEKLLVVLAEDDQAHAAFGDGHRETSERSVGERVANGLVGRPLSRARGRHAEKLGSPLVDSAGRAEPAAMNRVGHLVSCGELSPKPFDSASIGVCLGRDAHVCDEPPAKVRRRDAHCSGKFFKRGRPLAVVDGFLDGSHGLSNDYGDGIVRVHGLFLEEWWLTRSLRLKVRWHYPFRAILLVLRLILRAEAGEEPLGRSRGKLVPDIAESDLQLHSLADTVAIAPGVAINRLGLGTYRADEGSEVENEIRFGLSIGYRTIDTAALYGNEHSVGRVVRESGIKRDEIFVTTKLWNTDQGYASTLRAFDASLSRLGFDHVDLYLMHWPIRGMMRDTWRAMREILASGRTRAIGVCNFLVHHLDELSASASVPPALNQFEHHPRLQQPELVEYCREHGITAQAWAPIMRGCVLPDPRTCGDRTSPQQVASPGCDSLDPATGRDHYPQVDSRAAHRRERRGV